MGVQGQWQGSRASSSILGNWPVYFWEGGSWEQCSALRLTSLRSLGENVKWDHSTISQTLSFSFFLLFRLHGKKRRTVKLNALIWNLNCTQIWKIQSTHTILICVSKYVKSFFQLRSPLSPGILDQGYPSCFQPRVQFAMCCWLLPTLERETLGRKYLASALFFRMLWVKEHTEKWMFSSHHGEVLMLCVWGGTICKEGGTSQSCLWGSLYLINSKEQVRVTT